MNIIEYMRMKAGMGVPELARLIGLTPERVDHLESLDNESDELKWAVVTKTAEATNESIDAAMEDIARNMGKAS